MPVLIDWTGTEGTRDTGGKVDTDGKVDTSGKVDTVDCSASFSYTFI